MPQSSKRYGMLAIYSSTLIWPISAEGRLAIREEGACHDLRSLTARHVVPPPEVWTVPWCYARFGLPCLRVGPSARVACHHSPRGEAHDLGVEAVVRQHVLVYLPRYRLREACGVRHYLGELSTRRVVVGSEVGAVVWRDTRLGSTGLGVGPTARVASHVSSPCQPLYPHVEGIGGRDVLEALS